jgi:COX assembly mitochondrial protein 2
MHPPLNRPHPDCKEEINKLSQCHGNWRKFIGACNDIKYSLDACLKEEKKNLLKDLNKNWAEIRQREEDAIAAALGRNDNFQDFLAKDSEYLAAMKKSQASEPKIYQKNSTGGHTVEP